MSEFIKEILLAILQGITEPLPISSSGHLILAEEILNFDSPSYFFEAFVNLGSLFAITAYYSRFLKEKIVNSLNYLIKRTDDKEDFLYLFKIAIATVPIIIIGLLFGDSLFMKSPISVALALLVTGSAILFVNHYSNVNRSDIGIFDSILIGFTQVLAIIPGISRSGATTLTGMSRGYSIEESLRFSLLMYIPISLGIGVLSIIRMFIENYFQITDLFVLLVSAISTYISINWFIGIVRRSKLNYFAYYCLIVGVTTLITIL